MRTILFIAMALASVSRAAPDLDSYLGKYTHFRAGQTLNASLTKTSVVLPSSKRPFDLYCFEGERIDPQDFCVFKELSTGELYMFLSINWQTVDPMTGLRRNLEESIEDDLINPHECNFQKVTSATRTSIKMDVCGDGGIIYKMSFKKDLSVELQTIDKSASLIPLPDKVSVIRLTRSQAQ